MAPIIVIGAYGLIAAVPRVAVARTGKILENSADYSIQNTVRQALFLPLSRAQKYRAKTALDTFFYRCGDLGQAGIVWLGTRLVFTVSGFAICDALLTVAWLGAASALARSADPGRRHIHAR
jgi:ATP:ADP antiporter, AAA family